MSTTNPPLTIDLEKHNGVNVQKKKKRQVEEASTNDDFNVHRDRREEKS